MRQFVGRTFGVAITGSFEKLLQSVPDEALITATQQLDPAHSFPRVLFWNDSAACHRLAVVLIFADGYHLKPERVRIAV